MARSICVVLLASLLPAWAASCSAASSSSKVQDGAGGSGAFTGFGGGGGTAGSGFTPDGGRGLFGDANCGSSTFANQVPGALLVVLDRSGSMSDPPDEGGGGPSKWELEAAAFAKMLDSANPELLVGVLPFPAEKCNDLALMGCMMNPNAPGCDQVLADGCCKDVDKTPAVALAPLSQNKAAILAYLNDTGASGNTPEWHALKNAYDYLQSFQTPGQRYALLMTDGEPTVYTPAQMGFPEMFKECGAQADIENEVKAAAEGNPGINTFVIGCPGSEGAGQFLSQLALNGKTPKTLDCQPAAKNCHYQIGSDNFEQELASVLETIAGVISNCIFALPEGNEKVDPNLVNVVVETADGSKEIYKDPKHEDGWDYTDATKSKIQLYGPACDAYKAAKGNSITIILGCETVVK
ncbi:MAG: hypothetical protein HY744_06360 [Deltaproteobacteria bacterium]|nr:hypothetical protein [Deltaproteobacteria bacterium]